MINSFKYSSIAVLVLQLLQQALTKFVAAAFFSYVGFVTGIVLVIDKNTPFAEFISGIQSEPMLIVVLLTATAYTLMWWAAVGHTLVEKIVEEIKAVSSTRTLK